MPGHLFVIHGDLLRLACDGVLIPCDHNLDVNEVWRPLLPDGLSEGGDPHWLRLPSSAPRSGSHVTLPPAGNLRVAACVAVDPRTDLTVPWLVRQVLESIRQLSSDLKPHEARSKPLVGLPLFGTGQGGLHHRRGEVIDELVHRLNDIARDADVDIALVLHDARDYAAVQARRAGATDQWGEIAHLLKQADAIGDLAGKDELSLFIGSGVSVPLGLPDWPGLLNKLSQAADASLTTSKASDLVADAQPIVDELGETKFHELMKQEFSPRHHAIGHSLLAGLRPRRMVTTNYDPAMELALDPVFGHQGYDVLTRHSAHGSRPWLLKLHGDVTDPSSIVLTEKHYADLTANHSALHGVVQSLMLTSHLLFVGFSLRDRDFLELSVSVTRVRDAHRSDRPQRVAGTAIALDPSAVQLADLESHLNLVSMSTSDAGSEAARLLEIFLDRVAFTAASKHELASQYLLDPRYDAAFTDPSDQELRAALTALESQTSAAARRSRAWPVIERALQALGSEVKPPSA